MRLSLEELKFLVNALTPKGSPVVVELPIIKNESITIRVSSQQQDILDTPIEIIIGQEKEIIRKLGIYQIGGDKIWVVKD